MKKKFKITETVWYCAKFDALWTFTSESKNWMAEDSMWTQIGEV